MPKHLEKAATANHDDITINFRIDKSEALVSLHEVGDSQGDITSLVSAIRNGFARGTKVMKYDGRAVNIEDIKVGDKLMGDDSKPRTVLETHKRRDQLFRITPVKGESYIVTGDHILRMKYSNCEYISYRPKSKTWAVCYGILESGRPVRRAKTFPLNGKTKKQREKDAKAFQKSLKGKKLEHHDIVEISVKDYMSLTKMQKGMLKWYRTGVEFRKKKIDFDPYMLGIWLGDGSSDRARITNADNEVIDYFKENLPKYGCVIRKKGSSDYHYDIRQPKGRKTYGNKMLNFLRDNNLLNNKHIPDSFKYNSREVRLKLLAGIIDSDGHYGTGDKNLYTITFARKYQKLIDDTIYLIRSLGFSTYRYDYIDICKNSVNSPVEVPSSRFNFGGIGQEKIPCVVERKKAKPRKAKISNMVTGITIEKTIKGDYFSFKITNDNAFLLGDFSVACI